MARRSRFPRIAAVAIAGVTLASTPVLAQAPSASPVPAPVNLSPAPSASADPGMTPIREAILLTHVADGVTGCLPERVRAFPGEIAAVFCPVGAADERLVMRQFDSLEALATTFTDFSVGTPGETGACRTAPALEPRLDGGESVGQLACYDASDGTRVFIWTDERFDVLSWVISSQDRPFEQLYLQNAALGPVAVEAPTSSASPGASDAPFPTDTEADLLSHLPEALVDTCNRADFAVSDAATAAVVCSASVGGGSVTVTYQSYADAADMDAGYNGNLSFMGVERGTGPCSGGEWPGEETYTIDEEPAGRVACAELGDFARFMSWTDERLLIHGYAEGFGVALDDLHQWWLDDSGPVL